MSVWEVTGTPNQQRLVNEAITACDFPFDLLLPGLRARAGKERIPVVWRDLSAYGTTTAAAHKHMHDSVLGTGHVVSRGFVAGLAWSNGKIEIDPRCEQGDGQLGKDVFLAEAAHALDFFYLTGEMRTAIWKILHGGEQASHPGHDWFEPAAYGDQIGEAWMAGFVLGFSSFTPWQGAWSHKFTRDQARGLRPVILPSVDPTVKYLGGYKTVHKSGPGTHYEARWAGMGARVIRLPRAQAVAQGLALCRTCRP